MFEKLKKKFYLYKNAIQTALLTALIVLMNKYPVLADGIDEAISTNTARDIESRLFGSTKQVIMAFGGASIAVGFCMVAFKMIWCHKREEARTQAMESILWIGGGTIILGAIAVFTGFFWGTFGLK
ncbi:MAG: hypothetical protein GX982_07065 [Tissierellia bacterium]|nr:hypothetical protein [Tissierellia bacterium]